jgi:hypothetical protein
MDSIKDKGFRENRQLSLTPSGSGNAWRNIQIKIIF